VREIRLTEKEQKKLSSAQLGVLKAIAEGCKLSEWAGGAYFCWLFCTSLPSRTIGSGTLRRLKEGGYIQGETDRLSTTYTLTAAGREAVEDVG